MAHSGFDANISSSRLGAFIEKIDIINQSTIWLRIVPKAHYFKLLLSRSQKPIKIIEPWNSESFPHRTFHCSKVEDDFLFAHFAGHLSHVSNAGMTVCKYFDRARVNFQLLHSSGFLQNIFMAWKICNVVVAVLWKSCPCNSFIYSYRSWLEE